MIITGATLKQGASAVTGLLVTVGFTPADAPLLFFILIGVVTGTLAAWPKDHRRRRKLKISAGTWIIERLMLWGGTFMLVMAAATVTDQHARIWGAVAFFIIYGGNGIIDVLYGRFKKASEDLDLP